MIMDIDDRIFDEQYVLVEFIRFLGLAVCYIPNKISDFIISRIHIILD